jgi:RNA polymerase sigma-70 factor (ECF subfamily)
MVPVLSPELTVADLQSLAARANEAGVVLEMDEDAFRGFYERTSRPLWAYLARVTGDRAAADDLLQEAYYRFLRARADYESESHRRNSLFRIATNLVTDRHRRARPWVGGEAADAVIEHRADKGAAGRAEARVDLHRAMARLRVRDRMLLWLAYAEGASHREIAETVGVKASSVKLLLYRARHRLAGLLEERTP